MVKASTQEELPKDTCIYIKAAPYCMALNKSWRTSYALSLVGDCGGFCTGREQEVIAAVGLHV